MSMDLSLSHHEVGTHTAEILQHAAKLNKMRPRLETRDKTHIRNIVNYNRMQLSKPADIKRQYRIDHENKKVAKRVTEISCRNTKHGYFKDAHRDKRARLRKLSRTIKLQKIAQENEFLMSRLLKRTSVYKTKNWKKDFGRFSKVLRMRSKVKVYERTVKCHEKHRIKHQTPKAASPKRFTFKKTSKKERPRSSKKASSLSRKSKVPSQKQASRKARTKKGVSKSTRSRIGDRSRSNLPSVKQKTIIVSKKSESPNSVALPRLYSSYRKKDTLTPIEENTKDDSAARPIQSLSQDDVDRKCKGQIALSNKAQSNTKLKAEGARERLLEAEKQQEKPEREKERLEAEEQHTAVEEEQEGSQHDKVDEEALKKAIVEDEGMLKAMAQEEAKLKALSDKEAEMKVLAEEKAKIKAMREEARAKEKALAEKEAAEKAMAGEEAKKLAEMMKILEQSGDTKRTQDVDAMVDSICLHLQAAKIVVFLKRWYKLTGAHRRKLLQ